MTEKTISEESDSIVRARTDENDQPTDKSVRRRALLLGACRGSAVLATASPLKALAQVSNCRNGCTISGMQSINASVAPGCETDPCGGWSPGYWGQHWKKIDDNKKSGGGVNEPARPWPCEWSISVNSVLIRSRYRVSLFELMGNPDYASTDDRHWICAYLNALAFLKGMGPAGRSFGYTAQEVIALYRGTNPHHTSSEALAFFKGYMETHN